MQRFPALAKMFSLEKESDIPPDLPPHLKAPIEIIPSKQGLPTAKSEGKLLHSAYNPMREGEQAAKSAKSSLSDCNGCVFFSCGLGYGAISWANLYRNDTIIIVENDPRYFFTALSLVDWSPLFSHQNFIMALGTGIDSVVSLIEHTAGLTHIAISENTAQSQHASDYFSALRSLIERNKRKVEINSSTLEKFSRLWLKNTCKNIHFLRDLAGINIFRNSCPKDLPIVVLAAGPTLEEALPHLKEIKKRSLVVAVDTALRACLRAGVEPDFLVLTDPQYYAYRHIAGLKSPSSILITESAAYPPVFRFECKKIIMCASLFPLGAYIESKIGGKGTLVAGGSVSTTAWDFARFIGARQIYCAGLDLGFPDLQTHIRGSTFEEAIHSHSNRLSPAEKSGCASLFGANMSLEADYRGNKILTDSKMKMFAWWFESKAEEFKNSIQTFSLSSRSLKIPGFQVSTIEEFLNRPEKISERDFFLSKGCSDFQKADSASLFDSALENLKAGLEKLYSTAKKGRQLAEDGIKSAFPQKYLSSLTEIDSQILHSEYKEIASLVFPTEKRLASLVAQLPPLSSELKSSLQKSSLIYGELMSSVSQYKKFLP